MNITRDNPELVTKIPWPRGGHLPHVFSLVDVKPSALSLSAVYRSGDTLIVRCYNPTHEMVSGVILLGLPLARAERVRLDETVLGTLLVEEGGRINVQVRAGEVCTLRLLPADNSRM
jgi:hypothetical protein